MGEVFNNKICIMDWYYSLMEQVQAKSDQKTKLLQ